MITRYCLLRYCGRNPYIFSSDEVKIMREAGRLELLASMLSALTCVTLQQ